MPKPCTRQTQRERERETASLAPEKSRAMLGGFLEKYPKKHLGFRDVRSMHTAITGILLIVTLLLTVLIISTMNLHVNATNPLSPSPRAGSVKKNDRAGLARLMV